MLDHKDKGMEGTTKSEQIGEKQTVSLLEALVVNSY